MYEFEPVELECTKSITRTMSKQYVLTVIFVHI